MKKSDLRVTVVGDTVFATEIKNPGELDWRRSHDNLTYRPYELPGTVVAGVHRLRREMVTALVNDGTLTDDRWRNAFLAVSRHVLLPAYYHAGEHIDGETDRERWLRLVYSDTTLVTQRRPDAVTSSSPSQ